jgi:hypothetical protein
MRTTKCPFCDTEQSIIDYDRDDPVLSCGHTLTMSAQDERDKQIEEIYVAIRDLIYWKWHQKKTLRQRFSYWVGQKLSKLGAYLMKGNGPKSHKEANLEVMQELGFVQK